MGGGGSRFLEYRGNYFILKRGEVNFWNPFFVFFLLSVKLDLLIVTPLYFIIDIHFPLVEWGNCLLQGLTVWTGCGPTLEGSPMLPSFWKVCAPPRLDAERPRVGLVGSSGPCDSSNARCQYFPTGSGLSQVLFNVLSIDGVTDRGRG